MSIGKVLLGIAAGAATGVALGLLFAPAKGEMTRRRIARKSAGYAEDAKEKFGEYIDVLADEYNNVKEGAADFTNKIRD
jgi:gas vesicle protein